jgi:hypothetical protein
MIDGGIKKLSVAAPYAMPPRRITPGENKDALAPFIEITISRHSAALRITDLRITDFLDAPGVSLAFPVRHQHCNEFGRQFLTASEAGNARGLTFSVDG